MRTVGMGVEKKEVAKTADNRLKKENKELVSKVSDLQKENKELAEKLAALQEENERLLEMTGEIGPKKEK